MSISMPPGRLPARCGIRIHLFHVIHIAHSLVAIDLTIFGRSFHF